MIRKYKEILAREDKEIAKEIAPQGSSLPLPAREIELKGRALLPSALASFPSFFLRERDTREGERERERERERVAQGTHSRRGAPVNEGNCTEQNSSVLVIN